MKWDKMRVYGIRDAQKDMKEILSYNGTYALFYDKETHWIRVDEVRNYRDKIYGPKPDSEYEVFVWMDWCRALSASRIREEVYYKLHPEY